MKLYLLRHGDSVDENVDALRPLSEKGIKEVQDLAQIINRKTLNISTIFHSKKLRAKQTAEVLAKLIHFQGQILEIKGLNPMDDIEAIAHEINTFAKTTKINPLYVGHLPFLSNLVSRLILKDINKQIVAFEPSSMICMEYVGIEKWIINWFWNGNG